MFVARGSAAVYLLAIFTPIFLLAALGGWRKWWKHTQQARAWLSGSVNPDSKPQRWHEDATAVISLALIIGLGVFAAILVVVSWTSPAS